MENQSCIISKRMTESKKNKNASNDLQNILHETKCLETRTPLKPGVNCFFSNSDVRRQCVLIIFGFRIKSRLLV
jgi:hypothetical protein